MLFALLLTIPLNASPTSTSVDDSDRVLVLDLAHSGVDESSARVITTAVAEAAAKVATSANVVTSSDLKTLSDIAAEQQQCGIDSTACLAELAGAMDVKRVVHGTITKVDDELLVQLRIFDAATASSGHRVSYRGKTVSELLDVTPANVDALFTGGEVTSTRERGLSPLWGGIALGVGALAAGGTALVGGAYNATLTTPDTSRAAKDEALGVGRAAVIAGSVVAVGLGATGAVLLATADWE